MGKKQGTVRGGWYQGVDGQWYLTERPPAHGWVIGPDQRWVPLPPQQAGQPHKGNDKLAVLVVVGTLVLLVVGATIYGRLFGEGASTDQVATAPIVEQPTAPPPTLRPLTPDELWAGNHSARVYDLERTTRLLAEAANARDAYETGRLSVDVRQQADELAATVPPQPVLVYLTSVALLSKESINLVVTGENGAWNTYIGASNIAKSKMDEYLKFLSVSATKR